MVTLHPKADFVPRTAIVLGSTGSVGTQTMDIIEEMGLSVLLLTAGENTQVLAEQIRKFHPNMAAVTSEAAAKRLREELGEACPPVLYDTAEVLEAIRSTEADLIFHSIAGLAGVPYAIAAARSGKRMAMANKEAIIAAGDCIFRILEQSGGEMIPVDSEHSAIYRCLTGKDPADVDKIILTASGGPFFGRKAEELRTVTPEQALAHPTWNMGKKITIDSATLMNKGFEIIEAVRLFGVPEDRVDVVVHRQSIIHSLVEYTDHTFLAQMGRPDMRDCIRYAATAPHTGKVQYPGLDLGTLGSLTFAKPDTEAFPLLEAARQAIRTGGTSPTTLIAADETAVAAFLNRQIGFTDISRVVLETLERARVYYTVNGQSIGEADREGRALAAQLL